MDEIKRSDFDGWITMREASELTGAARSMITKAVRTGELDATTVATSYMVRVVDVMQWAKTRRGPGRPLGSRNL